VTAGWNQFRGGEFGVALKLFREAGAATTSNSPVHLAALYGEATTWYLRRPGEDFTKAEKLYHQIITLAPSDSQVAWSWLALARIKAQPIDGNTPELAPLVQAYQDVIDRFPFHPAGEEALLLQQAAKLEDPDMARTREVLEELETFLKTHAGSPWSSAAYGLIAHCGRMLGHENRRLEATIKAWKTMEIDPTNPLQDLAATYWQIATTAEFGVGDFETAREYYRKLIAEYPTEQRVFLAIQELKRMDELEARLRAEAASP
jgi:tetratricopeptide (TPR) repeat protein